MPNLFTLLKNNDAAKFIPELTISMRLKYVNVNSVKNTENSGDWRQFARFEGDVHQGTS